MSQDIVSDTLNVMMNAAKAGKKEITVKKYSKLLLSVLAIAKLKGYVVDYKVRDKELKIEIVSNIHGCNAIKPRFMIHVKDVDNYVKRYLPAKNIGILILSTSKGLMTHQTAQDKNMGGSLIAYFY